MTQIRNGSLKKIMPIIEIFLLVVILCFCHLSTSVNGIQFSLPSHKVLSALWREGGKTLYVGGAGPDNYSFIQAAIEDAFNGDTIYVHHGTYYENIMVTTRINLIGEDQSSTIIDGSGFGKVIHIAKDWVTLTGFTIRNGGTGIYNAGIYVSSDYNTISGNTVTTSYHGIQTLHANANTIRDNRIAECQYGLYLMQSNQNNLVNNTATYNWYSYYLRNSFNNTLRDNNASFSGCGFYLRSLSDPHTNNTLTNNNAQFNLRDLQDTVQGSLVSDNTYEFNQFLHNLQSTMISFDEVDRKKHLHDTIFFNVSLFDPHGDPCLTCTPSISTRPHEPVLLEHDDNTLQGRFTVTHLGSYALLLHSTDEHYNTVERRYTFFINATGSALTTLFLRGISPTHGQPAGGDAKSLLHRPPATLEEWFCGYWVQNSPDELPDNYPLVSLEGIDIHSWYKSQEEGYIGIQQFVTFDTSVDVNQSIDIASEYTWSHNNFSDISWPMDYAWSWYWLTLKLKGDHPFWMTTPSKPSYANFTHIHTTTPTIESNSNPAIIVLSASSPANDTTQASIVLSGKGTSNLIVQMPNTSLIYNTTFNGNECNETYCEFDQINGKLYFTLPLDVDEEYILKIEA